MEDLNFLMMLFPFIFGFQTRIPPNAASQVTHAVTWLAKAERFYGMNSLKLIPFLYELSYRMIQYGPDNYKGALPLLERAYNIQSEKGTSQKQGIAIAMARLGECLIFTGDTVRAGDLLNRAEKMMDDIPEIEEHFRGLVLTDIAFCEIVKSNPGADPLMIKLQISANPVPVVSLPLSAVEKAKKAIEIYNIVQSRKYGESTYKPASHFQYTAMIRAFNLEESMKGVFDRALKSLREPSSGGVQRQGCFVATAVYGSYDCDEVLLLRRFRDEKLQKSFLGRLFISVYYKAGPFLAGMASKKPLIKQLFRLMLDFAVRNCNWLLG